MCDEPTAAPDDHQQKLAAAREQFEREPQNVFAASALLWAMRKSGEPPRQFLRDARAIQQQFPGDSRVATPFGWLCYDASKESLDRNDLFGAVAALQDMVDLLPILDGDNGIYLTQATWQFGRIAKRAKERSSTNRSLYNRLHSMGRELLETALPVLSVERRPRHDGKSAMSPRDVFLEQLRGVTERAEEWAFLRDLCVDVLTGQRPVEDPVWFGKSLFDALRHVPAPDDNESLIRSFLEVHGQNAHVRVAQAGWLTKERRTTEAEGAYTMAVAMSRDSWSWRNFAMFLARQGELPLALCCLQAALFHRDPAEPGRVWKIHFELGRLSLKLGDVEGAAAELQLARWARRHHGWQADAKLERFLKDHQQDVQPHLRDDDDTLGAELLRQRLPLYRVSREQFLLSRAEPGQIINISSNGNLAWLRLDRSSELDPILRLRRGQSPPAIGSRGHAIVVPSWDRKKERPGLEVAWWKAAR